MLTMIMFIFLASALGFYFGYDMAGDYCREVLKSCADQLKESPIGSFVDEDYYDSLNNQFDNLLNESWSNIR